jgi:hypothetical protein
MFAKYLIRLDDACPTMKREIWQDLEDLFDEYNIKPIVGVIPNNKDKELFFDKKDKYFWKKIKEWQNKKWEIAMHGYDHILKKQEDKGLVPINKRTEFIGLSLKTQKLKIKKSLEIFNKNNIKSKIWIAPAHSFNKETLEALKSETNIKIISDGFSFRPFIEKEFNWIPLQMWRLVWMPFGIWTCCIHPNTITEKEITEMKIFIKKYYKKFIQIKDIKKYYKKNILDNIFEKILIKKYKS